MSTFRHPIQVVDPVNHTLVPIVLNLLGFSPEKHGH